MLHHCKLNLTTCDLQLEIFLNDLFIRFYFQLVIHFCKGQVFPDMSENILHKNIVNTQKNVKMC